MQSVTLQITSIFISLSGSIIIYHKDYTREAAMHTVLFNFIMLFLWLFFIYRGTSYEVFFSKLNTILLIIAFCFEITLTVYEIRRVEINYIQKEETKHEQWRFDIIFFLIMNAAIDLFIIGQYLYLGKFKKADAMEDAEEEEINFIIQNY